MTRRPIAFAAALIAVAIVGCGAQGSGEERPQRAAAAPPQAEQAAKPQRAHEARRERADARHFTVSVSGDLLMHQPLLDRARANGNGREYDFAPFFTKIRPYVAKVDLGICHVETPMGPGPPTTYPIFNTPTGLAASIHRSGWDLCDTASNHSLDGGQAGIDGTVKALHRANVAHTGSFRSKRASRRPEIVRVGQTKIGFVAYTDATNGFVPPHPWSLNTYSASNPKAGAKAIIHDAREARDAGADAVIAQLHWGDENSQSPNASQRAVAKKLTSAKVITAVVGQGPHVVQPIERINGKLVVFSEGNLVSNQAASTGLPTATQDGIIALLHFKARGDHVAVRRITYVPTWVHLGDYKVLPARPGSGELGQSYRRTVRVVGQGKRFKPEL